MPEQGWQLWQIFLALLGIMSAWSAIIIVAVQFMISRAFKSFEKELSELKKTKDSCSALERELLELKADLPAEYVRREDFIRFDVCINQKLDKLRDMISEILKGRQHEQ
ncbi:MAG: hypothetical protein LLG40_11255 [Deltaproteobacteria bacterium]|nr:hypothetical protein [Deltaproteobacteria bacterium]